jgi:hypothetical protein
MNNRAPVKTLFAGLAAAVALGACGSSHTAHIAPAAQLITAPGGSSSKIVLSAVGAQRIGLVTGTVRRVAAPKPTPKTRHGKPSRPPQPANASAVTIPASAVVYDPSGKTYAFIAVGHLTFTEVPVVVSSINGNSAYLRSGPHAGARVVSTGAEELYGVQTGVLGQT